MSALWSIGYGLGQANTRAAYNVCTGRIEIFQTLHKVQCLDICLYLFLCLSINMFYSPINVFNLVLETYEYIIK